MELNQLTNLSRNIEKQLKESDYEELNIYDEDYNKVGVCTRLLSHRLGLFHEVVNIFLIKKDGKILLQTRKDKMQEVYDLSAGGHMSSNDKNPEESIQREVFEEININLNMEKIKKISLYKRKGYSNILKPRETNNEFRHLYVYDTSEHEEALIEENFAKRTNSEAETFGWYSIEDIIDLICQGKAFDGLEFSFYHLLNFIRNEK